jgi:hypothetical protein
MQEPFFLGRIAGIELDVAYHLGRGTLTPRMIQELECNAGIHAPDSLAEYVAQLLAAYDHCTWIGEWDRSSPVYQATGRGQDLVAQRTPHIPKGSALDLEPYYVAEGSPKDWMVELKGKRILVVHPFTVSLMSQSQRLAEIFPGRAWFEGCTFQFVAPPMTMAGNHGGVDWQEHLTAFEARLPPPDSYDVALVAAGGYGMIIADRLYRGGVSVVYVGGALQLFFGVIGKRWMTQPAIMALVTDAWVRPSMGEQPAGHKKVENGCYW